MDTNANDTTQKESPLVTEIKWGFMKVEGFPSGKDFKLFPGGALEWNWTETNTQHVPGIQPQDIADLLKRGATHIVLSKGMENRLQVAKNTQEFLKKSNMELGVHYFMETTPKAVELYNQLVKQKKAVGALIHSTC